MAKSKALLKLWPADLVLSPAMRQYAVERGIDADAEFEAFHDWCDANAARYADWGAAWRTRIRNCVKWAHTGATDWRKRPIGFMDRASMGSPYEKAPSRVALEEAEIAAEVRDMSAEARAKALLQLQAITASIGRKL